MMRRLAVSKRFLILFVLVGLLILLLSQYGSIRIVVSSSSQSVANSVSHEVQTGHYVIHNNDNNVTQVSHHVADNRTLPKLVHAPATRMPLAQPAGAEHNANTARDKEHCWDLLDDVEITHVTNEGKTFTDEQLDVVQFKGKTPLIPKILHQTWDDYNIPLAAVPWVKSILRNHPDWDYWFWTQKDVQCYMKHKHAEYVRLYNSYWSTIFRTDVMRYFLLYDYGGIYLDLDVECLKPLDIWTHLAPSILAHETYDHAFVMHRRNTPNVMTTILATRPGHPYYKMLQDNLEKYHALNPMDVMRSTGPYFMDVVYNEYIQLDSPNSTKAENDILVIHPKYWLPTNDKMNLSHICSCDLLRDGVFAKQNKERILKNHNTVLLCAISRNKNWANVPDEQSYLDHHWIHTNIGGSLFKKPGTMSIFDIYPQLVPVSKKLGLQC